MQEKILQTASELFKNHGVRRISIDEICQQLRISKKTFYNYYPSKEDLVDATMTHIFEEMHSKKECKKKRMDTIDILLDIVKHIQNDIPNHAQNPIWYDLHKYYPTIAQKHEEIGRQKMMFTLQQFIEKGKKDGFIREDLNTDIFTLFMYPMQMQLRDYFEQQGVTINGTHYDSRELTAYCLDVFARIILSEKGKEEFIKRQK